MTRGPFSLVFPCIKPLVTPLNTRGTGAAQKNLIKIFIHKNFWEKIFPQYDFSVEKSRVKLTLESIFTRVTPENLLDTYDISSTTATFSCLGYSSN